MQVTLPLKKPKAFRLHAFARCANLLTLCPVTGSFCAGVAQLVEHLICNQRVGGLSPFASSRWITGFI